MLDHAQLERCELHGGIDAGIGCIEVVDVVEVVEVLGCDDLGLWLGRDRGSYDRLWLWGRLGGCYAVS